MKKLIRFHVFIFTLLAIFLPAELLVNNKFACRLIFPEKTGNLHFWTQSEVGSIVFPAKGLYLLTLKYSSGVNYGCLDFLYNSARQN